MGLLKEFDESEISVASDLLLSGPIERTGR
jgi:hypothetical protein